jgi:hypothetical protein
MMPPGRIALGLDLGQAQDYSALSLIFERLGGAEPSYDVPSLYRWQLGTGYPTIVGDVVKRVATVRRRERGATIALVVDGTGVGRPVVDMLAEKLAHLDVELIAVMITAGHQATFGLRDDGAQEWHVPKRELVSAMQILLQGERLRIAKTLPEAATLEAELKNFRMKFTQSANAQYEAWREGDHDDLVLGTALPCWALLHGPLGQEFAAAVGGVVPQPEFR